MSQEMFGEYSVLLIQFSGVSLYCSVELILCQGKFPRSVSTVTNLLVPFGWKCLNYVWED